jgi:hypothetical protein
LETNINSLAEAKVIKWLGCMSLVLVLTACASAPPVPKPIHTEFLAVKGSEFAAQAAVYVLRDDDGSGSVYSVEVAVDGASKGSIRRETYVKFPVQQGPHDLSTTWPWGSGEPNVAIHGDFMAGSTYYFLFSPSFEDKGLAYRFGARLSAISADKAQELLRTYQLRQ